MFSIKRQVELWEWTRACRQRMEGEGRGEAGRRGREGKEEGKGERKETVGWRKAQKKREMFGMFVVPMW